MYKKFLVYKGVCTLRDGRIFSNVRTYETIANALWEKSDYHPNFLPYQDAFTRRIQRAYDKDIFESKINERDILEWFVRHFTPEVPAPGTEYRLFAYDLNEDFKRLVEPVYVF